MLVVVPLAVVAAVWPARMVSGIGRQCLRELSYSRPCCAGRCRIFTGSEKDRKTRNFDLLALRILAAAELEATVELP